MFTLETVKGRYITGTLNLAQVLASGAITDSHFTTHSNLLTVVVRLLSADGKQDILVPFRIPDGHNGVDPLTASVYVDATAANSFSLSRIMLSDRQHQVHTITRAELLASAPMYVPEFNITFSSTESGGNPNINTTSGSGFTAVATPGTYGTVTVDGLGRVIAGSNSDSAAGLAADQSLASSVAAEQSRATAAEGVLTSGLAIEINRAQAAETSLASSLASEISRAEAVESSLNTAINNEVSRAEASEVSLSASLASEVSRAQAVESSLNSAIVAEASRASSAESSLASSIATEVSRAMAAESSVSSSLASEISRAEAAESSLNSALSSETATRVAGDASTLSSAKTYTDSAITNLVNGAPLALDTLKEIADQLANDENAAAALINTLAAEITRAQAAEASLASSIAAEQTARTAADSAEVTARNAAIDSAVAVETSARIAADQSEVTARNSAISSAVAAEATARDSAISSAIAAENTARSAADASLQAQITSLSSSGGGALFQWNVNGPLLAMGQKAKRVDGSGLYKDVTPSAVSLACSRVGTAGTLTVDVRKHQSLNTPVMSILPLFQAPITSVLAPISSIATQSIAAYNTTIATQSITRVKTGLSIQSIIRIQGTNQWKYSFSGSLLDADYQVGKSVLVAGASSAGNNGTFTIVSVNYGNLPSIVVTNASGVAQTAAAGTLDLQLFSYNYASAVSSDYVAGDNFLAASHTTAANNGSLTIYKVNQGGNNILVYNTTGATQASVLGTATTYLFKYTYSSAVDTTYFKVGEKAKMASHTNAANNGNFVIRAVNSSGNNIVVYNAVGVAQAGIAGNALPNRFNVGFATNPTSFISVGDTVKVEGHSTTANNGSFSALVVASTYVTVYNESGAALASASGTFYTCKYKVTLNVTTASLSITTDSKIEMIQTVSTVFEETDLKSGYSVLAVGTSDFTILETSAVLADFQSSPAGYISLESKSILTVPISIAASTVGLLGKELQIATGTPVASVIPANTWLGVWVTSNFTAGTPRDISVALY